MSTNVDGYVEKTSNSDIQVQLFNMIQALDAKIDKLALNLGKRLTTLEGINTNEQIIR